MLLLNLEVLSEVVALCSFCCGLELKDKLKYNTKYKKDIKLFYTDIN